MKRWQARGEVLDSDDEELSLGAESQSPQRPVKQARLEDDGENGRSRIEELSVSLAERLQRDEEEDEDWLQPKASVTYGHRTKAKQSPGTHRLEVLPDVLEANKDHQNNVAVTVRSSQQTQTREDSVPHSATPSTQLSDAVPDANDFFGHDTRQHLKSKFEDQSDSPLSSAPSSPLSERDVSPPRPPQLVFRLPTLGTSATPGSPRVTIGEGRESPTNEVLDQQLEAELTVRRNLRARNAKQLHPYMVDKAQYQQQCRERGLRPVRLAETQERTAETQELSISDVDHDSTQISSPARPSSELGDGDLLPTTQRTARIVIPHGEDVSDEDLPDPSTFFNRPVSRGLQDGAKRRKLFHPARFARLDTRKQPVTESLDTEDDMTAPPSPPPTSSDSARPALVGFRMPRGMTPIALPTPQISSDARIGDVNSDGEISALDSPQPQSKLFKATRGVPEAVPDESSPETSDTEPEQAVDERRLQREVKRIKGVLPASWLKVDLRAQQNQGHTSQRVRRDSSVSPSRVSPQRGVAQRVGPKFHSPGKPDTIAISDDGSDSESLARSPPVPTMRQLRLQFDRERGTTAPSDFIDDEQMEVDWVDPMLAGSSGKRSGAREHRTRQPRNTDTFRGTQGVQDFSEERATMRRAVGGGSGRNKQRKPKKDRFYTPKRRSAPRLSILDAPERVQPASGKTPQFVKLALRGARQQADFGRHSPDHKHIRLTTEEDTAEAVAVLRAWHEGSIAPREIASGKSSGDMLDVAVPQDENRFSEERKQVRPPLTQIHHNRQQRLPPPHSRSTVDFKSRAIPIVRRPKVRQTQLQPVRYAVDDPVRPLETPFEEPRTVPRASHTRRPVRRQPSSVRYRGAQLESLEKDFDRNHRAAAFERRMQLLTEQAARSRPSRVDHDFQLSRFLQDPDALITSTRDEQVAGQESNEYRSKVEVQGETPPKLPHRPRKRLARRIDADTRQYRQPSEPLPEVIDVDQIPEAVAPETSSVLHGLGPFGTRYATDFDIFPLPLGTYFHQSSFIGSGDFAASLDLGHRDLDIPTGRISIHVDGEVLELGPWTEVVASGLARIPNAVSAALESLEDPGMPNSPEVTTLVMSNVDYLLRSSVRYFARCLAFLDPVDRRQCIISLQRFIENLLEVVAEHEIRLASASDLRSRCLQYALVLARQAFTLSNDPLIQSEMRTRSREHVLRVANRLASHLIPSYLPELRAFYERMRWASSRESGIHDGDPAVCGIVILNHAVRDLEPDRSTLWSIIYAALNVDSSVLNSVGKLDTVWYGIFTLQPALELDTHGILQPGSRFSDAREDWGLVKRLTDRVFEFCSSTSSVQGASINDYVRATLTRCFHLTSRWGWWRCDPILGAVFDFFARRGLSQLRNEESRGSPKFLERLDEQPSFEVQPDDRSFHIFLKMLASGLQGMRKHGIYSEKKIGGIAWRFIPNHGRTYRKDIDVRQEDIDALRNHHDLLCTLYYSSPPGHRLRVALIQNLVDHTTSHREACRLSVRAWANLATCQASTSDDIASIEPFNFWLQEIFKITVSQFRLARTEVEQDVTRANGQGQPAIPQAMIDDTIIRNQRQITATLIDALASLKRVLRSSSSLFVVLCLLKGTTFWQVLDLFDSAPRRLHGMLDEAFEVFKAALDFQRRMHFNAESQSASEEESQDYGDSTALQEFASTQMLASHENESVVDVLHEPLAHLLSNLLGADETADDPALIKLIDVWVQLAQDTVQAGQRTWTSYITDYSADAWNQLRETDQKRKYAPYFLSRVAESARVTLADTKILTSWLTSLVDREATLNFQHVLTNALLNRYPEHRLLHNLPFTRQAGGQYSVSLQEFRQRRLALLSTVLSNMHDEYSDAVHDRPHALQELRVTYGDMLRQLMQAMKANYQEVQSNDKVADVQAQGGYVDFVQQVVSFLQQYTTEICLVDRFFTDSAAFPLPATDPTYVVGRLRGYVPKLSESKKRKELSVLIYTVSERAAVDGQQPYLVNQLVAAMIGVVERGNPQTPSLRTVLCTAIFPAYIEGALSTPCSWILVMPILEACGKIADQLLYDTRFEDHDSVQSVVFTIRTLLHSMATSVRVALTHPGQMSLPHVQKALGAIFTAAQGFLSCTRHMERSGKDVHAVVDTVARLARDAATIQTRQCGEESFDVVSPEPQNELVCAWPDTREFAQKQVRDKFRNEWFARDGQYFVRRRTPTEVVVTLGDESDERGYLLDAITAFQQSFEAVFERGSSHGHTIHGIGSLIV